MECGSFWSKILTKYRFRVGAGAFLSFEQNLTGPQNYAANPWPKQILFRFRLEIKILHKIKAHDLNLHKQQQKQKTMVRLKSLDLFPCRADMLRCAGALLTCCWHFRHLRSWTSIHQNQKCRNARPKINKTHWTIVDVKVMKAWPIFLVIRRIHLSGCWKVDFD